MEFYSDNKTEAECSLPIPRSKQSKWVRPILLFFPHQGDTTVAANDQHYGKAGNETNPPENMQICGVAAGDRESSLLLQCREAAYQLWVRQRAASP